MANLGGMLQDKIEVFLGLLCVYFIVDVLRSQNIQHFFMILSALLAGFLTTMINSDMRGEKIIKITVNLKYI